MKYRNKFFLVRIKNKGTCDVNKLYFATVNAVQYSSRTFYLEKREINERYDSK